MGRRSNPAVDDNRRYLDHGSFHLPSEVLSIFTSDLSSRFSPGLVSSRPVSASAVAAPSTALSTLTIETTILTTSYRTVRPSTSTTHLVESTSSREISTVHSSSACQTSRTSSRPVLTATSSRHLPTSSQASTTPAKSSTSPPPTTSPTSSPASVPSTATSTSAHASEIRDRHAIIGGLAGAIAGLVLLGILLCCIFRRRRKTPTSPSIASSDNAFSTWPDEDENPFLIGSSPSIFHPWPHAVSSPFAQRQLPPAPAIQSFAPPRRTESTASESSNRNPDILDGHLIRVSLNQWPRPFALGEGFRDSSATGQLHVTNPDMSVPPSRSGTPDPPPPEPAPAMAVARRDWNPAPQLQPPPVAARHGRPPLRPDTFTPLDRQEQQSPTLPAPLQIRRVLPRPPPPAHTHLPGTALTASVPVFAGADLEDPFLTPPTPDERSSSLSSMATTTTEFDVPGWHTSADREGQQPQQQQQPQRPQQQQQQQQQTTHQQYQPTQQIPQQQQQQPPTRTQTHFLSPPGPSVPLGQASCNSSRSNLSSRGSSRASDPFDLDSGGSTERLEGDPYRREEWRRWRAGVGLYEGT